MRFCSISARFAAVLLTVAVLSSCGKIRGSREDGYGKVMILYAAGYNSLSSYMREDLEDLRSGYVPSSKSNDALILISKLPESNGNYLTKTSPCIIRLSSKGSGKKAAVVMDTLKVLDPGTVLADAGTTRRCLEYVRDEFPAKSYGLVVSSHATGWLPNGYFDNSSAYEHGTLSGRMDRSAVPAGLPVYVEREHDPSLPMTKSITQEVETIEGRKYSREMGIEEFASAIPMHLDYLLFDACLMGGIEVAYAFRKVADVIGFSQTEVLADGYDYTRISSHLLGQANPDPKTVCTDFFELYDKKEGSMRSATISLVDCTKVEDLARTCAGIFERYRDGIGKVQQSRVQAYFYNPAHHWHYDLLDIVAKAGASDQELEELERAIDASLLYKAATPSFLGLPINVFSGYSMYLPSAGSSFLDNFYMTLSWNEATKLVTR